MLNYLIIAAIVLVLMALKLTKFVALAVVAALTVILVVKNSDRLFNLGKGKKKGAKKE